jgi:hypothetical protein
MNRLILASVIAVMAFVQAGHADFFECGYNSETPPLILYDVPDTVYGVAIYSCWDQSDSTVLPFWAYTMWDSTHSSRSGSDSRQIVGKKNPTPFYCNNSTIIIVIYK